MSPNSPVKAPNGASNGMAPASTSWQYKDRNANGPLTPFAHLAALIPNAYTYQFQAVEGMDVLQAANNFRPKLYAVPDQSIWQPINTNGLGTFSVYYTQARMLPGTLILGFSLTAMTAALQNVPINKQNNIYVALSDDSAGVPIFSEWLADTQFICPVLFNSLVIVSRQVYNGKMPWFPLPKPRPVIDPGVVAVGICSKFEPGSDPNISPQVLLVCAEPCNVVKNPQSLTARERSDCR